MEPRMEAGFVERTNPEWEALRAPAWVTIQHRIPAFAGMTKTLEDKGG